MKTLDCTILAYEGPILRSYLSIFQLLGFKAKRVIKLYNGQHKLRWLPRCLRNSVFYTQESLRNNYWPIKFYSSKGEIFNILKSIEQRYNLAETFFDLFHKTCVDFSSVSEECLFCDWGNEGWKNENLFHLLKDLGAQTYLFTGGGLVPKRILELPSTEFVHIHPGFLPYTRGGDGILWSILTRKKPGSACFYMVPQLDEGNVILTEEYESIHFKCPKDADLKTLYRLVFSFYDPTVRALCLKHVLEKFGTLQHLPTTPQDTTQGVTFHFMHDTLKEKVLSEIFLKNKDTNSTKVGKND